MATHVLVIVREWELRAMCQSALVEAGYRVTTSGSADGARYVLGSPIPPAAVLVCRDESLLSEVRDALDQAASHPVVVEVPGFENGKRGGPDGDEIIAAVGAALAAPSSRSIEGEASS